MSNKSYITDEIDLELWSQFIGESLNEEPRWFLILFVGSLIVLFVLSVTGNLLSCIVIYFDKSMHTATNYYLLNLAVSDLIVAFAILLQVDEHVSDEYQFGPVGCKLHMVLIILLWNNSILTMTALAIERYIGILHPMALKSKPVWRRVLKVIALIWVLAIAATIPEYFSVFLVKTKKSALCFTVPTKFSRVVNGILAFLMFIVPLVIMTFLYVMIAVRVRKMENSTQQDHIFNHKDSSSKVNKLIVQLATGCQPVAYVALSPNSLVCTKLIMSHVWGPVALTLSFVVCWLPFFTFRVIFFACSMQQIMKLKQWFGVIFKVVSLNSWFGMVLNPVLFSLKSTKFRKALRALWNTKIRRKRPTDTCMATVTTTDNV